MNKEGIRLMESFGAEIIEQLARIHKTPGGVATSIGAGGTVVGLMHAFCAVCPAA